MRLRQRLRCYISISLVRLFSLRPKLDAVWGLDNVCFATGLRADSTKNQSGAFKRQPLDNRSQTIGNGSLQ